MDLNFHDVSLTGACTGLLLLLGAAIAGCWKLIQFGRRIGQLEGRAGVTEKKADAAEARTNTLSAFHRRRGIAMALSKGIVTDAGPLRLTPEWRTRFQFLMPKIQRWYRESGHHYNEDDLYWAIEDEFGEEISQNVCRKFGLHDTECLLAAVLLCKETFIISPPQGPANASSN